MISKQDCEHPAKHPGSGPQPSSEIERPLNYAAESLEEYEQRFWERYRQNLRHMHPDWTLDQIEKRIEVGMEDKSTKEFLQTAKDISELLDKADPDWNPGGEARSEQKG